MTPWLLLSFVASVGGLTGAAHHGRVDGRTIHWRTVVVSAQGVPSELRLARPLPAGVTVEAGGDLVAIRDADGAISALALASPHRPPVLTVELTEPLVPGVISPPLFAGPVMQRVSVEGPLRFTPHPSLGFDPHVGFLVAPGVARDARHALDAAVDGWLPPPGMKPLYLTGDASLIVERGLVGTVGPPGVAVPVILAIGAIFVLIVGALGGLYRSLARRAARERAEAELEAEIGRLS